MKMEAKKQFIDYCYSFYGRGGIYDLKMTKAELAKGLKRLLKKPNYDFAADSFDRENLRDLILEERGAI